MTEVYNFAVIASVNSASYNSDDMLQAIAKNAVDGRVWNSIPGLFAFRSILNADGINRYLIERFGSYIVMRVMPSQFDGNLSDEDWGGWIKTFQSELGAMLEFHGEKQLTPSDVLEAIERP